MGAGIVQILRMGVDAYGPTRLKYAIDERGIVGKHGRIIYHDVIGSHPTASKTEKRVPWIHVLINGSENHCLPEKTIQALNAYVDLAKTQGKITPRITTTREGTDLWTIKIEATREGETLHGLKNGVVNNEMLVEAIKSLRSTRKS